VPGGPPGERDEHDPAIADTASPAPGGPGATADATGEPGSSAPPRSGHGSDPAVAARRAPRRVRTGDVLGRYELGDELGEGGMATVFRARDRDLRRDVAVKVLFPHLARRPEIVQRFHREARAAAGLEHANILRIYDVGGAEADDPPYIVMELIRGRTLLQEIEQRGAMLAEVCACIGALLGDALAAAHAAGVIHRDVKPANVLIAPGGRLLLADFGVARLETEDSLVTRTGALLGTPAYMSPEQACGDIATARSDLYSLGATLYQLATGTLPYAGPQARVMSLIAAGNLVAPVRRHSSCGPDLSRVIERLMAVEPGARPASAPAIAAELRSLVTGGGLGDPSEELAGYFEDPDGFLRARTPVVVGGLVAAARAAIADDKLPRAMALADRASALAPGDPEVAAVVRAVIEGGHASRRKRMLALSGAALAVVGAAVVLGWRISAEPGDPPGAPTAAVTGIAGPVPGPGPGPVPGPVPGPGLMVDASLVALDGPDAGAPLAAAPPIDAAPGSSAARAVAPIDAAAPARPRPPPPSAGSLPRVARGTAVAAPLDASLAGPAGLAIDAPLVAESPVPLDTSPGASPGASLDASLGTSPGVSPAPPLPGHLIVRNDLWCNLWIDGTLHGNRRNEPIEVSAGHHVVRCVNPVGEWTQTAEVAPGGTQILTGTLLRELDVRLDVEATIDGRRYARGTVVKLKPGNVEVVAGGKKQFITFRASCTLRDAPELGCYL
jgi:tRNA A-37 threonylcarbamoyl transferase component Bud32